MQCYGRPKALSPPPPRSENEDARRKKRSSLGPSPIVIERSLHLPRVPSKQEISLDENVGPPPSPRLGASNGGGDLRKSVSHSKGSGGSGLLLLNMVFRSRNSSEDFVTAGKKVFLEFLKKCYSLEVLEFWDYTTDYVMACRRKRVPESALALAAKIVQEFILPNAPQKMDLGYTVDIPLVQSFRMGKFEFDSFDEARNVIWRIILGLQLDASILYGIKSGAAAAITKYIESEQKRVIQLFFQRDVHPLLIKIRKSGTLPLSQSSILQIPSRSSGGA